MRHARIAGLTPVFLVAGVVAATSFEAFGETAAAASAGGKPAAVSADLKSFVAARCLGCHDDATREAGVSLEAIGETVTDASAAGWLRALEQIERGTMPPPSEEQPTAAERQAVALALEQAVVAHARSRPVRDTTVMRRLNRTEYRRTLEDLLHLDFARRDPTIEFPEDTRVHGFASNGEKLVTSSFLMRQYLAAAKDVVNRAVHFEKRPEERTWSLVPPFNWKAHYQHGFDGVEALLAKRLKQPHRYESLVYSQGSLPMEGLRDGVPQSGRYSFRILAESKFRHGDMNPKKMHFGTALHDPAQPHRLALTVGSLVGIDPNDRERIHRVFVGENFGGNLANVSGGGKVLATWDVPDDVPTWLECNVWLEAGQFPRFSFQNGPIGDNYRIMHFVNENKYSLLDKDQLAAYEASTFSGNGNQLVHFETPRIRIYRVDVTGPIEEQWPPASHRAIFGDKPYESAAAGDVLRAFAERAWRRPVTAAEIEPLLAIVRQAEKAAVDAGTPPEEAARAAIKRGVQAVLCDRAFLYREERGDALDGYEIASRLSYFLWSSMPDETLLSRAAAGELVSPDARRREAERLLADPRSDSFVNEFLDGWLTLNKLGVMKPQGGLYFSEDLEPAMRGETRLFFKRLLRTNGPISDFLDSDYALVNRGLAKVYGIDWKQVEPLLGKPVDGLTPADLRSDDNGGATPSRDFALVKLTDKRRGGLLGQASVLTLTANGVDTNPVIRGSWVLEHIIGAPPSPPPPNIPVIEPDVRGTTTLRQRLEKHRDNPSCLACHRHIDPPGFALESFDVIGQWRGSSKEATGGEFAGISFDDITGFKAALMERQPQFARALVEKLLIHLLGRDLTAADRPAIRGILDQTAAGGYRLRDIVLACCASDLVAQK
jgi:hypothetical protein